MKLTMNWLLACLVWGSLALTGCSSDTNDSNNSTDTSDVSDATDASDPMQATHQTQAQPTSAITTGSPLYSRAQPLKLNSILPVLRDSQATFNLTIFSRWNFMAETLVGHPVQVAFQSMAPTTQTADYVFSSTRALRATISRLISMRLKVV